MRSTRPNLVHGPDGSTVDRVTEPSKWTAADLPSLAGRTFVVTGANSGIGLAAARELAGQGRPRRARRPRHGQGRSGRSANSQATPRSAALDLADLASVRAFADELDQAVDVLINNAGVMNIAARRAPPTASSCSSAPTTSATSRSRTCCCRASPTASWSIASGAHRSGSIDFDDLNSERGYQRHRAYGADQAREPALHVRAAAPARRGRLAGAVDRRAPRAGRDEPPEAARATASRTRSMARSATACSRRAATWAPCPRCTPPRRTSPATATSAPTAGARCAGTRRSSAAAMRRGTLETARELWDRSEQLHRRAASRARRSQRFRRRDRGGSLTEVNLSAVGRARARRHRAAGAGGRRRHRGPLRRPPPLARDARAHVDLARARSLRSAATRRSRACDASEGKPAPRPRPTP